MADSADCCRSHAVDVRAENVILALYTLRGESGFALAVPARRGNTTLPLTRSCFQSFFMKLQRVRWSRFDRGRYRLLEGFLTLSLPPLTSLFLLEFHVNTPVLDNLRCAD